MGWSLCVDVGGCSGCVVCLCVMSWRLIATLFSVDQLLTINSLTCLCVSGCVYAWIVYMCSVSKPCHIIFPLPSLHNHPILSSLPSLAISQLSAQPRQRISSFEEARKLDLKNERMPPREDSSTSLPMATPPASPSKDQTFEDMN